MMPLCVHDMCAAMVIVRYVKSHVCLHSIMWVSHQHAGIEMMYMYFTGALPVLTGQRYYQ
jgi:hypothetical protein